jgi:xanthine dehydrogenase accessory factor
VKRWKETGDLLARLAALAAGGRRAALATVVGIVGSAYRRPGAKFLVEDDGRTSGSVSGGCLEADVREHALHAIRTGVPRLLHYDTGSDDRTVWGLGLGCNGSVDVFVQPATTPSALAIFSALQAALGADAPLTLTTILEGPDAGRCVLASEGRVLASSVDPAAKQKRRTTPEDDAAEAKQAVRSRPKPRAFTETLVPPPHLVVCGAGDDARPLVAYAADIGFRVTVVDHRRGYLSRDRFPAAAALRELRPEDEGCLTLPIGPRTAAVVMTHSLAKDGEWLRRLLAGGAFYIGLLGPRERAARLAGEAGAERLRVFGPVGLDLGAEGPEQIAISVLAELLALIAGRSPKHLRDREAAIHAG